MKFKVKFYKLRMLNIKNQIYKGDLMEKTKYDILVRKDDVEKYAAFCPQLNILVKGTSHEEVELEMRKRIQQYLEKKNSENVLENKNT